MTCCQKRAFCLRSALKLMNWIWRYLIGSKISTSATKFVFFGPIRIPRCGNKCGTLYSGARHVALWASCFQLYIGNIICTENMWYPFISLENRMWGANFMYMMSGNALDLWWEGQSNGPISPLLIKYIYIYNVTIDKNKGPFAKTGGHQRKCRGRWTLLFGVLDQN